MHRAIEMVSPGWLEALPTWTTTGTSQSVPYPIGTLICVTPVAVPCKIGTARGILGSSFENRLLGWPV